MADGQKSEPPGRNSMATLEIQKHIKDLTSSDYAVRDHSVTQLEKFGKPAAEALVNRLLTRGVSHDLLRSFEDAFEEIGRPCVDALMGGLDRVPEIRKAEDVYLIELFAETLGHLGRGDAKIAEQLEKLNKRVRQNHARLLTDTCIAAKVRIHVALAGIDSRRGLDDLLTMLGDGRRRLPDGLVAALERVGDKRALLPLTRLYTIEEAVTFSGALAIKGTLRDILRREKLGTKDRVFKEFNPEERAQFDKLVGWGK